MQRQNELKNVLANLASLQAKKKSLLDQIASFHQVLDTSMTSIQKKGYVPSRSVSLAAP